MPEMPEDISQEIAQESGEKLAQEVPTPLASKPRFFFRREGCLTSVMLLLFLGISVVGALTLLGGRVSQVFSNINSGLDGGPRMRYDSDERIKPVGTSGMTSEHAAPLPLTSDAPAVGRDDGVVGTSPSTEHAAPGTIPDVSARPQGHASPLKAGEINDNERFNDYRDYVSHYDLKSLITSVDLSERYIIRVTNQDQHPLLNATVRFFDGDTQVFESRTLAGGNTIFQPGALGLNLKAPNLRVVAEQGNQHSEMSVARNVTTTQEIALAGTSAPSTLSLDIVFMLDTTGSMGDELARVQETIDTIARRIDGFTPRPVVRFGLVAYRDQGDDYVTRVYDFTSDVTTFRKLLNGLSADGGGDTPEAVTQALHDSVHSVSWSNDAVRMIFMVADAGPHAGESLEKGYVSEVQEAVRRGIRIYPIAASNTDTQAEYVMRQLAQETLGRFIFLTYQSGENSGVPGETTVLQAGDQLYSVDRLDDLIVQVVQRELAAALGVK